MQGFEITVRVLLYFKCNKPLTVFHTEERCNLCTSVRHYPILIYK